LPERLILTTVFISVNRM